MMLNGYGFWIDTATGMAILLRRKHINAVLDHPEVFGFKREELEEIYRQEGEPLGLEGRARERIMAMAVKKGWIRVRRYRGKWEAVSFNVPSLQGNVRRLLSSFSRGVIQGIKITTKEGGNEIVTDFPETGAFISDRGGRILQNSTLGEIARWSEGKIIFLHESFL